MTEPRTHSSHPHPARRPAHGGNRVRGDFDPGFSFLRASLAARLAVVMACAAVLWAAVLAVTA